MPASTQPPPPKPQPSASPSGAARGRRRRTLALCALPVVALVVLVLAVPLPFSLAQPGLTADVLGSNKGRPVITLDGPAVPSQPDTSDGRLLMTTIGATAPDASVRLPQIVRGFLATDRAVLPRDAVYPVGEDTREIEDFNRGEMRRSQNAAVTAALREQGLEGGDVDVTLRLADVGGPSAGLLFALGIVDRLDDGRGAGDLTDGRTIAGTGTIDAAGKVGAVGGVPLKTQAARRDGATVFLVPEAECADARANLPRGLRLIPVTTLDGTLDALTALRDGGRVPSC